MRTLSATKMGRFFRKHDRLVSSFSLLILLGTFLAKEYFRDDYKDRASAIESADAMFSTREQIAEIQSAVNALLSRLPAPKGHPPPPSRLTAEQRREVKESLKRMGLYPLPKPTEVVPGDDDLGAMNEVKRRCWFLIDTLPDNEEMEKHIKEIDKQLQAVDYGWIEIQLAAQRGEQIRERNTSLIQQTLQHPESPAVEVAASSRQQYHASYSPDGSRIVFASRLGGPAGIWVGNDDGSNLVEISNPSFESASPEWSPDWPR